MHCHGLKVRCSIGRDMYQSSSPWVIGTAGFQGRECDPSGASSSLNGDGSISSGSGAVAVDILGWYL